MPVRTKKGKKKASKKASGTRTKKKTTKKRATKSPAVTQEHRQLAMYHDPFSRATKQPKIPDGKVTESLGFQTQAVRELIPVSTGNGRLDILLWPGMNCGVSVRGEEDADGAYSFSSSKTLNVGFVGSSGLNFAGMTNTGGQIDMIDQYAYWRIVSQGLRLSLLNPAEEDDGWWEAMRVNSSVDSEDWQLHHTDASGSKSVNAVVAPTTLLSNLTTSQMVNERSYATGLLRDLKDHVFSLHPIKDDHDIKQQVEHRALSGDDVTENPTDGLYNFERGRDDATDFIERVTDQSYDMIYIRIHGRNAPSKSRLHMNVVSNQEITFAPGEREARFHTTSGNIGPAMDTHIHARRSDGSAANIVPMTT
jgi:hypothetical protein